MSIKISVVDDTDWVVKNLCQAVEVAGFEAVAVVVTRDTSLEEVLGKIAETQLVLLDHQMYKFSGEDVAKRIPQEIILVTTSEHRATDRYCQHRIYGKDRNPFQLQTMAQSIAKKVDMLVKTEVEKTALATEASNHPA